MKGIVHPFSKALYEQDGEGNIRVTAGDQFGILTYGARNGEFSQVDTTAMPAGLLADLIFNDSAGAGTLQFDGLAG